MPDNPKIRVLIIDDSILFREIMAKGLASDSRIEVVGFANDPFEAKEKIPELDPDVITLDIEMPRMDGIKFLRYLLPQYPLPVIVLSMLKTSVFEAMDAGAIDFVAKPENPQEDNSAFFTELRSKIIAASQTRFGYRRRGKTEIHLEIEGVRGPIDPNTIIAIGASTGGTDAINSMVTKFTENMPGIVIVQHMPAGFTALYAKRINSASQLNIKEAADGDEVVPGHVFIAPGDFHMTVEKGAAGYRIKIAHGTKVNGHRPSVDVLFNSVAEAAGDKAIGVILTGMGTDGAIGLKRIRDYGGYTIGQDERSSVVYGMPMAAYISGAVMMQLPLYRIPDEILRKLSTK